jgi:uncharacterized protein
MTLVLDTSALLALAVDGAQRGVVLDASIRPGVVRLGDGAHRGAPGDRPAHRGADPAGRPRGRVRLAWDHLHVVPLSTNAASTGPRACRVAEHRRERGQPVRLTDAIHFAAAERLPRPIRFVTFDPAQIGVATRPRPRRRVDLRTYTEVYPAGATSATLTVAVTFDWDPPNGEPQIKSNSATIALPGDACKPPPAGEWCSPGYWRQPHHLDSWAATGISPDEKYNAYFDPDLPGDPTLLEVLQSPQRYNRGTDSFNKVGDLLSGAHPDVAFGGKRVEDSCPLN